jgi:protein TonB
MLRAATFVMSFLVHGLLAYVSLTGTLFAENTMALEQGTGEDTFVIEKGIGIEGFMQEGTAVETVEANETPTQMSEARPQIDEVKPVEKDTEIIKSDNGPQPDDVPVEGPLEVPQQAPQMATVEQLQEQSVVEEQKSAGEKREGGDTGVKSAYLGKIHNKLKQTKVNPHSRASGTVLVRFAVGPSGALLSREIITSSGSQILDNAAIAAIEKAAPFPAFPETMKVDKIVEVVPYRFSVR